MRGQLGLFTPRILWDLDIGANHIRVCLDDHGEVVTFHWPRSWRVS